MKYILPLILSLLISSNAFAQINFKVFYGKPLATQSSVVLLVFFNAQGKYIHFCSGTFINGHTVLTAGHCIGKNERPATKVAEVDVIVGDPYKGQHIPANVFVAQPEFVPLNLGLQYDVALIKVSQNVPNVRPIRILYTKPKLGSKVEIRGYGRTENGEYYKLNSGEMKISSYSGNFYFVTAPKVRACFGDSGGPVILKVPTDNAGHFTYRIAGVVSTTTTKDCSRPENGIMGLWNRRTQRFLHLSGK